CCLTDSLRSMCALFFVVVVVDYFDHKWILDARKEYPKRNTFYCAEVYASHLATVGMLTIGEAITGESSMDGRDQ
ncbi:hypothetical protein, partial [uncultured Marinobacter sp.]|uniref:hypothetical protein n=1 Tax=uncultured Marinobacter sp. TaxID=187379 RepID=UPI002592F38C